ncbi:MAG: flagellar basal body-associated FliL family protein [Pseudomonadota bacterium]
MSAAANAIREDQAGAPVAPPAKKSKALVYIISLLMLAAGGGGGFWYSTQGSAAGHDAHGKAADAAPAGKAAAIYLPLQPAFVVNLEDAEALRYMQVDLEVMARNPKAIEDAKNHMPRIRNSLLLLFGQQHAFELGTRAGKEALQAKALAEIQRVLKEETGSPGIEAVYFSSFVIQ